MDIKNINKIKEIEENINKNIAELRKLSVEVSKEFGTRIMLGQSFDTNFGYNGEYVDTFGVNIEIYVKIPRIKGPEFLSLSEDLLYNTPNLKEIILKLRAVEKLADEHDPLNYEEIWLNFDIDEFMEKSIEEIYNSWETDYHKWDDYDDDEDEEDDDDDDEYDV